MWLARPALLAASSLLLLSIPSQALSGQPQHKPHRRLTAEERAEAKRSRAASAELRSRARAGEAAKARQSKERPAVPVNGILACSADVYEEDDDYQSATPIAIGDCQDHNHCDDGEDWLSFDVVAGQVYTAQTCNVGSASDTYLIVYDDQVNWLDSDDDSGPCDWLASGVAFTATVDGTYYVEVEGWGDDDTEYQVCIDSGCLLPDEYEDDDDAGSATAIFTGDWQTHDHCDDISDWLGLNAVQNGIYRIRVCNEWSAASDPLLLLFDPREGLLAQDDNSGDCGAGSASLVFTAQESGVHYLEVTQADGIPGPGREYEIEVAGCASGIDAWEEDDEVGSASPIAVGDCQDHNHCDDITDWLRFDVVADQLYTLSTCNTGWDSDTLLRVFNASQALVGEDDDSGNCDWDASAVVFRPPQDGTWFAEVSQSWGEPFQEEADYQVCLEEGCAIPDDFEPDNEPADATKVEPGWWSDHNHCDNAVDWVSFAAVPGEAYEVSTCNRGGLSDTLIRVWDPFDNLIGEDDNGGSCDGRASSVAFVASVPGLHLVEAVQADGEFGGDRGYELIIDAECVTPDAYEDDDSRWDAKPIAEGACQDHDHCDDAYDYVSFLALAGETYTIETCNVGPASDTTLTLYDPAGNTLGEDDDGGDCDSLASRIEFTASENGDHFVGVSQYDWRSGVDREYQVCVRTGSGIPLLRAKLTQLSPPDPPLAEVLPLDPVADLYLPSFISGGADPEPNILGSADPLVFYGLDGAQNLRLTKASGKIELTY